MGKPSSPTLQDAVHPAAALFLEQGISKKANFNSLEIKAIDFLTTALIRNNLWHKFKAIYPFVGGNRDAQSINLRNPFRHTIVWYSGPLIFNLKGVTNQGGGYGNTFVAPAWFSDDNIHVAVYNATNWNDANTPCRLIGARAEGSGWMHTISLREEGVQYRDNNQANGFLVRPTFTYNLAQYQMGKSAGLDAGDFLHVQAWGLIVGVNGERVYTGGQILGRISVGEGVTQPINPTVTGSNNVSVRQWSQFPFLLFTNESFGSVGANTGRANLRFASIGWTLTDNDNKLFYEIVEEFQTILQRQVGNIRLGEGGLFINDTNPALSCSVGINSINMRRGVDNNMLRSDIIDSFGNKVMSSVGVGVNINKLEVFGPRRVFATGQISGTVSILGFNEI